MDAPQNGRVIHEVLAEIGGEAISYLGQDWCDAFSGTSAQKH